MNKPAVNQNKNQSCFFHIRRYISRGITYLKKHGLKRFTSKVFGRLNCLILPPKLGHKPDMKNDSRYQKHYFQMLDNANSQVQSKFIISEQLQEIKDMPKLIAFYLAQYHPIPENDTWWGKGFTEWRNVSKAVPQFEGHYQPRFPGELGYYDLRLPAIQERQAELAQKSGIYGFAFYYYWFSGKRLLETPLDNFAHNHNISLPFCICWANENWTRRWDGNDHEVLMHQEHCFENDKSFIHSLESYLINPRYLCVGDRPLILVYRPMIMGDISRTIDYWRNYCIKRGLNNPYLVGIQAFDFEDPRGINFDAAVQFPPLRGDYKNITKTLKLLNGNYKGTVYDYRELFKNYTEQQDLDFTLFRGVTPMWDNEARRPAAGNTFINSSPKLYQRWLDLSCYHTMKTNNPEKLTFINAWNEWAEGAYLEPDRKYGYQYLQATHDALSNISNVTLYQHDQKVNSIQNKKNKIAVHLHVYYQDQLDEIASLLGSLDTDLDVYITSPLEKCSFREIIDLFPDSYIIRTPNRGRDIASFIEVIRRIESLGYSAILKIHTKKSPHRKDGDDWRRDIFTKLINARSLESILNAFYQDKHLGIVGPSGHLIQANRYWGTNYDQVIKLLDEIGISTKIPEHAVFVAGSMFWAKPEALKFLCFLPRGFSDYDSEPIPSDGNLVHAIERVISLGVILNGYNVWQIDNSGIIEKPKAPSKYQFAD